MEHEIFPVTLPDGYLDFYKDLETWQYEVFARLKKNDQRQRVDAVPLLTSGKPLLDTQEFDLDLSAYGQAFLELAQHLAASRESVRAKVDVLLARFASLDLGALVSHLMEGNQGYFAGVAEDLGISGQMLMFVADHALRPFLRAFAYPYQESIAADTSLAWNQGVCPVCGAKPALARVREEDGRRYLFCDHCFTEWMYKYLACIHCGNDEVETVRYFSVEGDDANQVFVCEKCKGYIKTYDERRGHNKEDLFITSIATFYLDMLARREGYGKTSGQMN